MKNVKDDNISIVEVAKGVNLARKIKAVKENWLENIKKDDVEKTLIVAEKLKNVERSCSDYVRHKIHIYILKTDAFGYKVGLNV